MDTLRNRKLRQSAIAIFICCATKAAVAEDKVPTPSIDANLNAHFTVDAPASSLLSEEARQYLRDYIAQGGYPVKGVDVASIRRSYDEQYAKPLLAEWRKRYAVDIRPEVIGGVQTDVLTPLDARPSGTRILINLHGGGFLFGARSGGQLESVAMAGIGRVKVVTIDYREGPEYKYPAASEDVAAVYKALIKTYKPANVAIYGCSAGGLLAAQSVAWFQTHNIPLPGAIGIFCSGALPFVGGPNDSQSIWPSGDITGVDLHNNPLRSKAGARMPYLEGIAKDDPVAWPAISRDVLAKFPPTLVMTATRDPVMSQAVVTHSRLQAAGVDSQLYVQEGLGHSFMNFMPNVPEAVDAYKAAWKFFDTHLGW